MLGMDKISLAEDERIDPLTNSITGFIPNSLKVRILYKYTYINILCFLVFVFFWYFLFFKKNKYATHGLILMLGGIFTR